MVSATTFWTSGSVFFSAGTTRSRFSTVLVSLRAAFSAARCASTVRVNPERTAAPPLTSTSTLPRSSRCAKRAAPPVRRTSRLSRLVMLSPSFVKPAPPAGLHSFLRSKPPASWSSGSQAKQSARVAESGPRRRGGDRLETGDAASLAGDALEFALDPASPVLLDFNDHEPAGTARPGDGGRPRDRPRHRPGPRRGGGGGGGRGPHEGRGGGGGPGSARSRGARGGAHRRRRAGRGRAGPLPGRPGGAGGDRHPGRQRRDRAFGSPGQDHGRDVVTGSGGEPLRPLLLPAGGAARDGRPRLGPGGGGGLDRRQVGHALHRGLRRQQARPDGPHQGRGPRDGRPGGDRQRGLPRLRRHPDDGRRGRADRRQDRGRARRGPPEARGALAPEAAGDGPGGGRAGPLPVRRGGAGHHGPGAERRRGNPDVSAVAISVWFRLLRVHGLLLRQVRRSVPDHLTLPRFDVMAQLHRRAEGMTPGELTRALLVTAGNVTGIVDRLVREGLAERRPLPADRRTLLVRLTPRGRRTMERAIPRHRRDVQAVLAAVPRAELRRLRQALGCAMRALELRGPRPGQVMRGSTADRLYTGAVLKERK